MVVVLLSSVASLSSVKAEYCLKRPLQARPSSSTTQLAQRAQSAKAALLLLSIYAARSYRLCDVGWLAGKQERSRSLKAVESNFVRSALLGMFDVAALVPASGIAGVLPIRPTLCSCSRISSWIFESRVPYRIDNTALSALLMEQFVLLLGR